MKFSQFIDRNLAFPVNVKCLQALLGYLFGLFPCKILAEQIFYLPSFY